MTFFKSNFRFVYSFLILLCFSFFNCYFVFAVPSYFYDSRRYNENNKSSSSIEKKLNRFSLLNNRKIYKKNFLFKKEEKQLKKFTKITKSINQKTTVIIAPHPDDEILCCSNVIKNALSEDKSVKVIVITNGDAFDLKYFNQSYEYGQRRMLESLSAAKKLNLNKEDIIFLNFPDQGLSLLKKDTPFLNPYTKQNKTCSNSFFPNKFYTKDNLISSISFLLNSWNIDEIYIPSPEDEHPDHKIVGVFMKDILQKQKSSSKIFTYLVHNDMINTKKRENKDSNKFSLIHLFASQFWTNNHKNFLENFSFFPEIFNEIHLK